MHYDPIKNIFANIIRKSPFLRVLFYKVLDLMFLRSWYVRKELKNLRKRFENNEIAILDAGTGYGQYTYFMHKKLQPNRIHSIDVKEEWINDCKSFLVKKTDKLTFDVADLLKITYDKEFDLIICIDVMEHIEDDVTVFKNFYNALKPGGFLLVNSPSIYGGSDVHEDEDESFIGEHARDGYSEDDFHNKLEPIGFSIEKIVFSYGFWGDKAWRLGIKYPMMLMNLSKAFLIFLPFYFLVTFPFTLIMMGLDMKKNNHKGSGISMLAKK